MTDSELDKILELLKDGIKSWIDDQLSGTSYYIQALEALEADVTKTKQAIKQYALEREAIVRHDIVQSAPICEHRMSKDKEHDAYCGFINSIWLEWAITNGAKINLDGTATLKRKQERQDG